MDKETTTVWYLIGTLAVGGTERTLVDLVNHLDRDQFTPVVWTITEPGPLADDLDDDVSIRSLGAAHKLDVRAVLRLVFAVYRDRPAILQSFLFFDNVLARFAGLVNPETTVITGVREVPNDRPLIRSLVDRATLNLSDVIVSNSKAGADYIISRGVPEQKVRVVRNGRNIETFATATEPPEFRSNLGIPDEAPIVGTVGRLVTRKGHYDLIAAWPSVRERHPDANLIIVGDGPEWQGLEKQARELGIIDSVHFLGRRDDVPELLATFDLFVFPSHYEGLPGALLEAMAAGVPIVATPVDGNAELVTDGEHGIHVPVRDSDALADAVNALLADSEQATQFAARAQERARSEFSMDWMVSSFEEIYTKYS